jgi:hypothetical protein
LTLSITIPRRNSFTSRGNCSSGKRAAESYCQASDTLIRAQKTDHECNEASSPGSIANLRFNDFTLATATLDHFTVRVTSCPYQERIKREKISLLCDRAAYSSAFVYGENGQGSGHSASGQRKRRGCSTVTASVIMRCLEVVMVRSYMSCGDVTQAGSWLATMNELSPCLRLSQLVSYGCIYP